MSFSDLKIKRIETSADTLTVELMDGRVLTVPLAYYPTLLHATDAERNNCQPIGAGYGIEWPDLDYHLSVEGLLQGQSEAPGENGGVGFRVKAIQQPCRPLVTGKTSWPGLYHLLEVLGRIELGLGNAGFGG